MNSFKVILINITIALSLLFLLFISPPVVFALYNIFKPESESSEDEKYNLHIYKNFEWSKDHFKEFSTLRTKYYDYITWRRDDFAGSTVNIVNGVRKSNIPNNISGNKEFWFFGGSTTWGTGVTDSYTYPSIFASRFEANVRNYGETGYIARQSLAYLQNLLITIGANASNKDISVVFYDGINDVAMRCRSEVSGLGTDREPQIRGILESKPRIGKYSFKRTIAQLVDMANSLNRRVSVSKDSDTSYDCFSNPVRAREVAKTLVMTWKQAQYLAESNGMSFLAILQPVAYFSDTNADYLELDDSNDRALADQYETVYPLIIEYAKKENLMFANFTSIYDRCTDCYIDSFHVGPQAHEKLVTKLGKMFNF